MTDTLMTHALMGGGWNHVFTHDALSVLIVAFGVGIVVGLTGMGGGALMTPAPRLRSRNFSTVFPKTIPCDRRSISISFRYSDAALR